MAKMSTRWVTVALSSQVVVTSLKVSLVVGTLLVLINHGAAIIQLTLTKGSILQIALTYAVPYCVSTYSSTKAIGASTNR